MPDWIDIFRSGALERHGKDCATVRELAGKIEEESGEPITYDAIRKAHRRHAKKLGLGPLAGYCRLAQHGRPPHIRPEDIRHELSQCMRERLQTARVIVVTSALNNTPLHADCWGALQQYVRERKAALLVLPSRYRNPTSRVDGKIIEEDAWWPSELLSYMTDDLHEVHEQLWIMGHVRVQATASRPLRGMEALSRGASAIFAHAQLAMATVATPQHSHPKILYTTGSVSEPRYSDTRAGIRGDFHHGLGAVVVELDDPLPHIRALVADDDGGFYDLDRYYYSGGSEPSDGCLALVTGDEHALFADQRCKASTYGECGIAHVVQPKAIVRHDVFDSYSISHHHKRDAVTQIAKHRIGYASLAAELQSAAAHIDQTTPEGSSNLIVSSNHHDHLLQWMQETRPLDEPWNADVLIDLWSSLKGTISMGPGGVTHGDPLALWLSHRVTAPTHFLGADSSESIAGVLVGLHGDRGPNGARGTRENLSLIGAKTVIGHSHSPGIHQGCYQVGTSSCLRLGYNSGPSSWAHAHCIIHRNGKRQIIFIHDGRWRA